ncbi:788_t:CDS:2 [Rhizophagus irregularis]|nr:788_t:CDS:2 [Rhizophagus irregularis]
MTERDGHHLKKILKNDRKITLEELHKDFINSTSTYIRLRKHLISKANRKKSSLGLKKEKNSPLVTKVKLEGKITATEDNILIYIARVVKAWKQENDMASLSWSVQMQMHLPLPKNRNELWVILQEEWLNIEVDKYQKLVDSMPC